MDMVDKAKNICEVSQADGKITLILSNEIKYCVDVGNISGDPEIRSMQVFRLSPPACRRGH